MGRPRHPTQYSDPVSDAPRITRRGLLVGGAAVIAAGAVGVAAVDAGLVPGRSTLYRLLGGNGEPGTIPDVEPGPFVEGDFVSDFRLGVSCGWAISYPPGYVHGDSLPVLVVLHGYGVDHRAAFDRLGLDRFLADAVANGATPFAIASVDGGDSYWHPRDSGEDSARMIINEFLPLLAERWLQTERIALLGWSMGGYGALYLAHLLEPRRVAAVVAESPALWSDYAATPPGAFDDEADYVQSAVQGRQSALDGIPVRIDCGTGDAFYPETRDYVRGFTTPPAGGFQEGGHDFAYWTRMAPEQLAFVAAQF